MKQHSPAAERNKGPILEVLRLHLIEEQFLSEPQLILTNAEGSGKK